MENCIFCKIIKGDLPCSKIYEDNKILAFLDIQPINKGHVLIIPKTHKKLISELDDKTLGNMIILANKINQAIRESDIKSEGVNLFLADGEAAGQEVFHAHLHVIPRFDKDGFGVIFPKDYKDKSQREELDIISKKIQSHLK